MTEGVSRRKEGVTWGLSQPSPQPAKSRPLLAHPPAALPPRFQTTLTGSAPGPE